ncbi:MAG: tRNA 2-thiouridine(34) synthase MnmA [Simkaniaceae bacterium]|nr:tRNA 2-thiouridine(34) synthase MnmA [Simkaniaceae bacterium]
MKNSRNATVAVGLSGGVDSSVAAYLLKEQGYNVIGLFMKNWEEGDDCPAEADYQDVVQVCEKLDIPFYSFNFAKEYWDGVFGHFIEELKLGHTPNPDILCNREIKFKVFLDKALEIGADFLATGHYAKIEGQNLLRASDSNKDQSYFLYTLKSQILEKVLFPLSDLNKAQVREIAQKLDLITHDKRDSTGICFIGKRNFKEFMTTYLPPNPGNFIDESGKVVGRHDGLHFYTIGQRKGLGIGGPGEAWFVSKKDVTNNAITLVQGENHPDLLTKIVRASDITWVAEPPSLPLRCSAKIRYRSPDAPCLIEQEGENLKITFDSPERAATSRQSIVFYQEKVCLGGGMIL